MRAQGFLLTGSVWLFALVSAAGAAGQGRTVWDGIYTTEQAERGRQLYGEHCSRCHGDGLGGVESSPPLTGAQFGSNWEGRPVGELLDRMRMTMPQDQPGSLSRAQNADILAYMLQVNGFPAGGAPLEGRSGALAGVAYRMYKPD